MIKFSQLLTPENIRLGLVCSSKKRVFELLGKILAPQLTQEEYCHPNNESANSENSEEESTTLAEQELLENKENEICCIDCLLNREKLGNSALGNGIAMPKGRLEKGSQPLAVFLQLNQGLDYGSSDGKPVDLILALLLPSEYCETYAKELPVLAKRLMDKTLCKQLRAAQTAEEIWNIFKANDDNFEIENQQSQQNEESQLTDNIVEAKVE